MMIAGPPAAPPPPGAGGEELPCVVVVVWFSLQPKTIATVKSIMLAAKTTRPRRPNPPETMIHVPRVNAKPPYQYMRRPPRPDAPASRRSIPRRCRRRHPRSVRKPMRIRLELLGNAACPWAPDPAGRPMAGPTKLDRLRLASERRYR